MKKFSRDFNGAIIAYCIFSVSIMENIFAYDHGMKFFDQILFQVETQFAILACFCGRMTRTCCFMTDTNSLVYTDHFDRQVAKNYFQA